MRNSIDPSNNFQQYTIINNNYGFEGGCAKFIYRGHEISFSTKGYQEGGCLNEVCVFQNNDSVPIVKTNTVQEAIDSVNELLSRQEHCS